MLLHLIQFHHACVAQYVMIAARQFNWPKENIETHLVQEFTVRYLKSIITLTGHDNSSSRSCSSSIETMEDNALEAWKKAEISFRRQRYVEV